MTESRSRVTAIVLLVLGLVGDVAAQGPDLLARFDGGVGETLTSNVSRNVMRGIDPAGRATIADLKAAVDIQGRITVIGRGLILEGDNAVGENANQRVFATVMCEATAPFVERSTKLAGVALALNGDFRIDDVLNPMPLHCASPMLLIRSAASGAWFAAGIPKFDNDH